MAAAKAAENAIQVVLVMVVGCMRSSRTEWDLPHEA